MKKTIRIALPLALAIAAAPAFANDDKLLTEARGVASGIPPKLLGVLEEEIKKGGPEGAIGVCREKAPAMARAASEKSGWAIRRVSLKNRNPKAVPDAWEEAVLKDFDKRTTAGEKPTGLEKGEAVTVDAGHLPAVPRHARPPQPGGAGKAEGALPGRQGGGLRRGGNPRRHHPQEAAVRGFSRRYSARRPRAASSVFRPHFVRRQRMSSASCAHSWATM